jgi:DNA-binding transcriptional LysR family regulator
VARCGGITSAARALGLAQSTVSASVAALELEYGVILFQKLGRRIGLSVEGRLFFPHACEAAEAAERAQIWLAAARVEDTTDGT